MWLHGDRRVGPKPIGAAHRAGCNLPPFAPIIKKRPWAMECVVRHAPYDTVQTGGPQWAARAIRQIGDGKPRTIAERMLLAKYPDTHTPSMSSARSTASSSVSACGDEQGEEAGGDGH